MVLRGDQQRPLDGDPGVALMYAKELKGGRLWAGAALAASDACYTSCNPFSLASDEWDRSLAPIDVFTLDVTGRLAGCARGPHHCAATVVGSFGRARSGDRIDIHSSAPCPARRPRSVRPSRPTLDPCSAARPSKCKTGLCHRGWTV